MQQEDKITFNDVLSLIYDTRWGLGLGLGLGLCLIFGGDIVSFFG